MENLPRTFCITLRETPLRKEKAIEYFNEVGLKVEFFEGIHGPSFGLKTTIPNYEIFPGREYFITPGHVGCILSHLMLWNVLLTQPEEEFLIIEDDVQLCDDFFEKFVKFKLELSSDWEFVSVGWLPITGYDESNTVKISDNIAIRMIEGTHAYMVKKSALKTLIETNQLAWSHIDIQISKKSFPKLVHYSFEPSLISQRSIKNVEETTWVSLCYDWSVNPEWLKMPHDIPVIMGTGWYPLEKNNEGYMIWSDGRGEFVFDNEWDKMKIEFIFEGNIEKKLKVVCPSREDQIFDVQLGSNNLTIDTKRSKSVILVSDTFKPSDIYKTPDCRRLGIRLLEGITLIDKFEKSTFVSLYSMYGQKKFEHKGKNDGLKVIRPKYSYEDGRINLNNQIYHSHHRSGWEYVLNSLMPYHKDESVVFDGFLENNFAWQKEQNAQLRLIPYREPWVGVFHNPPNMPNWFSHNSTPTAIIRSREFQDSLGTCKGLYTLSEYHAKFLKCSIKNIPIETFFLPTETPNVVFGMDKFIKNNNKKIINIGTWLRKLISIYELSVDQSIYQKIKLTFGTSFVDQFIEIEKNIFNRKLTDSTIKSVVDVRYMNNDEYDELLSNNIVFLDLYDSSANNVIVECIVRGTPLLVNPLPAVMEYLGEDYPFYFKDLEEASSKLKNIALINSAHEYLVNTEKVKERVTGEYFLNTIKNGKIWNLLT